MINAKEKKLIEDGFDRLYLLNNKTWTPYRENIFNINRKIERKHRDSFGSRTYPASAPISLIAKYFAVKHILDALYKTHKPYQVKDFLFINESAFLGQALAEEYQEELLESFLDFDSYKFQSFDYSEMVCTANKSCESNNQRYLDSIEVA
jgi:hypothetical protein